MLGQIIYDRDKAGKTEYGSMEEIGILQIYVPEGKSLQNAICARRAAKRFRHQRVELAAIPPDYPYLPLFVKRGIRLPDESVLRRACADQIVSCVLRQMGNAVQTSSVAVVAQRRSGGYDAFISSLARKVRYLTLAVADGEALAEQLRRQCGIAVRLGGEDEQNICNLTVSWDGKKLSNCIALNLAEKALKIDYDFISTEKQKRPISKELLAAIVQINPLYAEQIKVLHVDWRE